MEKIKLSDNNLDKKQPSNLEAEQALLGSILVNNDIIDEISTIVNPSTFYDPAHTANCAKLEGVWSRAGGCASYICPISCRARVEDAY